MLTNLFDSKKKNLRIKLISSSKFFNLVFFFVYKKFPLILESNSINFIIVMKSREESSEPVRKQELRVILRILFIMLSVNRNLKSIFFVQFGEEEEKKKAQEFSLDKSSLHSLLNLVSEERWWLKIVKESQWTNYKKVKVVKAVIHSP